MGIRIGAATATIYLSLGSLTSAGTCPSAVTAAVHKAHADAAVTSCKQEHEKGKSEFEVKLATAGGQTMELDVSPDGTILLTEEPVALSAVPAEVMNALGSKYAGAKPTRADGDLRDRVRGRYEEEGSDLRCRRNLRRRGVGHDGW
jgi:hypothetical protein